MEITISIPDTVVESAHSRGLTPETYVEELLVQEDAPNSPEKTPEERLADLERFFEGMTRYSYKIPHLPDEALTRESFYSGHD